MNKVILSSGIIFSILAVVIGAFGAHALKPLLTASLADSFETAVRYQVYHGLALFGTGILYERFPNGWIRAAGWLFSLGILLFAGSIYLLVYLKATASIGLGGLGIVTPLGGTAFIFAWLCLLMGIWKRPTHRA